MAFNHFTLTKDWNRPSDFPTIEASEAQVRADIQYLFSELKDDLNALIDALAANVDGSAGADNVGATALSGGTATTVQGILEELKTLITTVSNRTINGKSLNSNITLYADDIVDQLPEYKYRFDTPRSMVLTYSSGATVSVASAGHEPTGNLNTGEFSVAKTYVSTSVPIANLSAGDFILSIPSPSSTDTYYRCLDYYTVESVTPTESGYSVSTVFHDLVPLKRIVDTLQIDRWDTSLRFVDKKPASAVAAGLKGQVYMSVEEGYIYVCVDDDCWRRFQATGSF